MQAPGRFLIHHEIIKTINMYSSLGRNKNSIVMRMNENDPNAQKTFQNLPADNESVKVCLPSRPFLLTSKSGSRGGWGWRGVPGSYRGRGRNTLDTSPVHHQTHTHSHTQPESPTNVVSTRTQSDLCTRSRTTDGEDCFKVTGCRCEKTQMTQTTHSHTHT